jgi:uncharacterized protein (TIGR00290 family)
MVNALLSWSGGKDSSIALNEILKEDVPRIAGLFTTVTKDYDRISVHGVRRSLLRKQASSLNLPLYEVLIPKNATNEIYEREMISTLLSLKSELSISVVVFGDLFLQDIREYRERLLSKVGMQCVFPIWGRDTKKLAEYFIDAGFKAILCTVDPKLLDGRFCGFEFDRQFLSEISSNVDPCGENGEFHTFVYDGPIFKNPVEIKRGKIVQRDGFFFADVLPLEDGQGSG